MFTVPSTDEAPFTEEAPSTEETPSIEEGPFTEEAPSCEETPSIEEGPSTEEAPSTAATAGACVLPHLRVLRALGFCRAAPPAPPAPPAAPSPRQALALCATTTYTLLQLIYAYEERSDMNKLSGVLFVLLCHATCITKQLAFRASADVVDVLVARLDEPSFNSGEGEAERRRAETTRLSARLLSAYSGCAVATCGLWAAFALADRLRGRPTDLPFWTGFRYDSPPAFAAVLTYSLCMTCLVAVGNTTMDAFAATLMFQCRTQLANVRDDFESLPERVRSSARLSGRNFETVFHESFVNCLVHYKKIIESCALLEEVFGAALLVQFGVGGWILCMAAYKIVSLKVLSIEFVSTSLFILCILTELLLYCYFGNELALESSLVSASLYGMEWTALDTRQRRDLLVVMTRAQRPLRPAAGRVLPLTLETYLTILKSSYSFYAMLRQTKH